MLQKKDMEGNICGSMDDFTCGNLETMANGVRFMPEEEGLIFSLHLHVMWTATSAVPFSFFHLRLFWSPSDREKSLYLEVTFFETFFLSKA